jgi:hypothetical protein
MLDRTITIFFLLSLIIIDKMEWKGKLILCLLQIWNVII